MRWFVVPLLAGCRGGDPIDLPTDPGQAGAPVGVQTFVVGEETFEVWYPTDDDATGQPDRVDLVQFIPDAFLEVAPEIAIPYLDTTALRDAPVRDGGEPWPVVLFSHGFGGFRQQSVTLTAHLASRGYVVLAPDHEGRGIGDLIPCLLTTTLSSCNFGFDLNGDPGVVDMDAALTWLSSNPEPFVDLLDLERIGIFGHSAGGGTTTEVANTDPRIKAAMPMAGAGELTTSAPSAVIGGSCDAIVPEDGEGGLASAGATATAGYWSITGAGHLAFSDICALDFGAVGAQLGLREDANNLFLGSLIELGTDGCAGGTPDPAFTECGSGFLDLSVSDPILRFFVTAFFDEHLADRGPGLAGASFDALVAP